MYRTIKGHSVPLGEELGKGAAGKVFLHGRDPQLAVKIFHPEVLAKDPRLPTRLEKLYEISRHLQLMIEFKGARSVLQRPVGSFPQELVTDTRGNTLGFLMPTVKNGIDLSHVVFARDNNAFYKIKDKPYYSAWFQKFVYGPQSLRNRFILCYYLAHAFGRLYNLKDARGTRIDLQLCNFDIKSANILVALEDHGGDTHIMPFLLDLDNLTLQNKTGTLAPQHPQMTPEYMAPEGPLDQYYDYFSIAVIFYQLIFNIHPFEGIQGKTRFTDGTNRDFFMQKQCFPWGKNGKFLTVADSHANFSRLPGYMKDLFIKALDAPQRQLRPDMEQWQKAFVQLLRDPGLQFDRYFRFS